VNIGPQFSISLPIMSIPFVNTALLGSHKAEDMHQNHAYIRASQWRVRPKLFLGATADLALKNDLRRHVGRLVNICVHVLFVLTSLCVPR